MSTQTPTTTPVGRMLPAELATSLQQAQDAGRSSVILSTSATTRKIEPSPMMEQSATLEKSTRLEPSIKVAQPILKLNPDLLKWLSDHTPRTPSPTPAALPPIDLNWSPITFPEGTPVGGWAHVTLNQDGTARFTGHLHDSGAPSYTDQIAFIITAGDGTAFTLAHKGEMHGTFSAGSRNDDWDETTNNPNLKAVFSALSQHPTWHAKASVNWDVAAMINELKAVVGVVETVIALF